MVYFDAVVAGLMLGILLGSFIFSAFSGYKEAEAEGEGFSGKVFSGMHRALESVVAFGMIALGVIVTCVVVVWLWRDVVAVF
jgi:hypothetical protein